jgi:ABC-type microcin C transport system duplicated ATPase subunit YejF
MSDPDKADDMDRILDRFGHVQEEYEHLGGYALESQAREVLHGLGFKDDQIDGDVGALSGGWKMRVALARVLLGMPDVLLMDEPTNHLDIESIIWLEQFLKSIIETCTILTTKPNALVADVHNRMPVILKADDYDLWLDPTVRNPALVAGCFIPFDATLMKKYPVGTRVNRPENDDPECAREIAVALPQTLF